MGVRKTFFYVILPQHAILAIRALLQMAGSSLKNTFMKKRKGSGPGSFQLATLKNRRIQLVPEMNKYIVIYCCHTVPLSASRSQTFLIPQPDSQQAQNWSLPPSALHLLKSLSQDASRKSLHIHRPDTCDACPPAC